jgi:DNA-binding transcriptional MerR regulator
MAQRAVRGSGLRIGELAAQFGLSPRTIRYYEAVGLLPAPRRTPSGYRVYDEADVARLRFVLRAKAVGLRLGEIAEVLRIQENGQLPCDHVRRWIDRKLAEVDRQLAALRSFRTDLLRLQKQPKRRWGERVRGICPILETCD